jgi:Flp pilus assembly protein TadG
MLNIRSFLARSHRRLRQLANDQRGTSAVEFALLLPLMLVLYLGTVEISQGVAANRKVTLTARAVADLTAQATNVATSDMKNILDASTAIIAPYPTTNPSNAPILRVRVSEIMIDSTGKTTVVWSVVRNKSGTFDVYAPGSTVTLPGNSTATTFTPASGSICSPSYIIWGEAQYDYTPAIGYVLTGTLHLHDNQMFMRPRQNCNVASTSTAYP